jgi:hypothetical protein
MSTITKDPVVDEEVHAAGFPMWAIVIVAAVIGSMVMTIFSMSWNVTQLKNEVDQLSTQQTQSKNDMRDLCYILGSIATKNGINPGVELGTYSSSCALAATRTR